MTQVSGIKLDVRVMQAVHERNNANTQRTASTNFWDKSKEVTGKNTDLATYGDSPSNPYAETDTSSTAWLLRDYAVVDDVNGKGPNTKMVINDGAGIQGGDRFLEDIIELAGEDEILSDEELQAWFEEMCYTGEFDDGQKAVMDVLAGLFNNKNEMVEILDNPEPPEPGPSQSEPGPDPSQSEPCPSQPEPDPSQSEPGDDVPSPGGSEPETPSEEDVPVPSVPSEESDAGIGQNYFEKLMSGTFANSHEASLALFEDSDADNNGFLDAEEMDAARFNGNYPSCTDRELVDDELAQMAANDIYGSIVDPGIDTARDGQISYQEFIRSEALKATNRYLN